MEEWSVHHLFEEAEKSLGTEKAISLQQYSLKLRKKNVPVLFTLNHLAKITETDYHFLRGTVERKREGANYRLFAIKKRSGGRRFIHAVCGKLLTVQQFINSEILQHISPHPASFAFHSSGGIRNCAQCHCRANWLFHFDLADFFHGINEIHVFNIFSHLGYRRLLSFELARLCTTTHLPARLRHLLKINRRDAERMPYWPRAKVGVLPQGAPTSPMLGNLAAKNLDFFLESFATRNGLVYTRYADDITLSASKLMPTLSIGKIRQQVSTIISHSGFIENKRKTRIAGPGSRKMVLGLLVDADKPRINKETYHRIERHLYAAAKYGVTETADHEGFDSAFGFYNHLAGLVAFVKDVDRRRWENFNSQFSQLSVPWLLPDA